MQLLRNLELVTGLEPATCSLRMSCTTNCATQAKYYPKLYNTKMLLSRLKKRIFYDMMFLGGDEGVKTLRKVYKTPHQSLRGTFSSGGRLMLLAFHKKRKGVLSMEKIAVIDLGSNSVRMSIFDEKGKTLAAFRSTIRLSEGMLDDMILKTEPQMRAVKALSEYENIMKEQGISKYRAVATAAVRKAKNKQEFLALVRDMTGIEITVIDGVQEAALDSLAVERCLNCKKGIICDIGGGSTELIGVLPQAEVPMVSIPYGSRGICEMFFAHGETKDSIQKAQGLADGLVAQNPWVADFKGETLVGIGGTFRALAKLDLADFGQKSVENYHVDPRHMIELVERIEKADMNKRRQMAGIGERADIIQGGLILVRAVLDALRPKKIAVADVGVREGVFFDLVKSRGIL